MQSHYPSSIEIVEVGPRDGLQAEATFIPTGTKLELVRQLADAGLRRIEVASFAHPGKVPQMADAEQLVESLAPMEGIAASALILNRRSFDRALEAGIRDVNFVVSATDTFGLRNQGATTAAMLDMWRDIAPRAAEAGMQRCVTIAVAFGCPFEGIVDARRVLEIAVDIAASGCDEINLADTIGVAIPVDVHDKFGLITKNLPDIRLRAHFHNTRQFGYANVDAALQAGVRIFDSSIGGSGGCPFAPGAAGNIATEDLVYMMNRSKVDTGVSVDALISITEWLEKQLGRILPSATGHTRPFG